VDANAAQRFGELCIVGENRAAVAKNNRAALPEKKVVAVAER